MNKKLALITITKAKVSGWLPHAVGIRSRTELLNATVGTNVFNNVSERSFVLLPFTTLAATTARFLLTAFRLHYNIHASSKIFVNGGINIGKNQEFLGKFLNKE